MKRRATRRARSGSVRRTGSRNRRQGSVRSRESSTGFDRSSSIRSRPNGLGRRQKLSCDSENNKSETQKLHSKRDVETGSSEVFLPKPPEKSVKDQIYNIFSNGKSAKKIECHVSSLQVCEYLAHSLRKGNINYKRHLQESATLKDNFKRFLKTSFYAVLNKYLPKYELGI